MPYTLEVCVASTASALAAMQGGAHRLELCADLVIGGTTPSLALLQQVKAETGLPVRALLRPRFGDFCYDRWELAQMAQSAARLVEAGADGIGDKTTGFLHNYNSNGNKNIADGIAVFKGTEVDEKSVPCDAVFYGATITTDVYNPAGYGYRIPDNDLYSTKNLLSGVGQPFFGQGTNTFLFPDGGNDAGEFVFFGGSFTQGGYYRGRSAVCRKLAADASGSLADIESGDGVTTYL